MDSRSGELPLGRLEAFSDGFAIAVAFALPTLGMAFFLLTALYLGVPGRRLRQMVRPKS